MRTRNRTCGGGDAARGDTAFARRRRLRVVYLADVVAGCPAMLPLPLPDARSRRDQLRPVPVAVHHTERWWWWLMGLLPGTDWPAMSRDRSASIDGSRTATVDSGHSAHFHDARGDAVAPPAARAPRARARADVHLLAPPRFPCQEIDLRNAIYLRLVRIVWVKVKHVFVKLLETLRNLVHLPSWSSWRRFRLYFARKSPLRRR
jgi:hypothetical protein